MFAGCGRGRWGEDRYCRGFEAGFGGVGGLFVVDVGGAGDVVAEMWGRHP